MQYSDFRIKKYLYSSNKTFSRSSNSFSKKMEHYYQLTWS